MVSSLALHAFSCVSPTVAGIRACIVRACESKPKLLASTLTSEP